MLNVPLLRGGTATILQNGDQFYPAMLEALRNARDSINFEVYIYEPDEIGRQFMDVLMERARAGVEVRMLLDGFGCWRLKRRERQGVMGARVKLGGFRPLPPRKLGGGYPGTPPRALVID